MSRAEGQVETWPRFLAFQLTSAGLFMRDLGRKLGLNATIYGDKAYTQYSLEDDLQEFEKIRLIADRKTNATRQHSGCIQYLQSILRKRIETTFSQLTSMLPRKIHAVTKNGFLLKLIIFIVSFPILSNKRCR